MATRKSHKAYNNWVWTLITGAFVLASSVVSVQADETQESNARRLFRRIAGVPPTNQELSSMVAYLQQGRIDLAAFVAMNNPKFYTLNLATMLAPFSDVTNSKDLVLNDFIVSAVGLIYNNERFDQALYGDFLYTAEANLSKYSVNVNQQDGTTISVAQGADVGGLVRNSNNNAPAGFVRPLLANTIYNDNRHYEDLEAQYRYNWHTKLQKRKQTEIIALLGNNQKVSAEDVSGLITTRAMGLYNFGAGTNRRAIKNIFNAFLCKDLTELHDKSAPETRIRQDVDRSPSGDSRAFDNQCRGCHAGMDSMAGAFAYFNPDPNTLDRVSYTRVLTPGTNKQFRQSTVYPAGYALKDNSWVNYWWEGPNAALGWRTPVTTNSFKSGVGGRDLGSALAATEAFSQCMAQRAFEMVCLRKPTNVEKSKVKEIARDFETGFSEYESFQASGAYNMRGLIAKISNYCFGE